MFLRLLLLVAGFAYGAMPMHGIAAAAISAPAASAALADKAMAEDASAHAHHGAVISLADCPHGTIPAENDHSGDHCGDHSGHKMMTGGHCSTCLALPLIFAFPESGLAVRTAEAPGLAHRLVSTPEAPLLRPPRLRG